MSYLKSIDETKSVIGSLSSLVHVPSEFKEFPKRYLSMIQSNNSMEKSMCYDLMHPGLKCREYAMQKLLMQTKIGLKISAIFILVPALVQSLKRLIKEPEARWRVLEKFIRSTLYLTLYAATPAIAGCIMSRFWTRIDKTFVII